MNTHPTFLAPERGSALVADISLDVGVQLLPPAESSSPQADLAARYLKLGFRSELADGEMVAQVVNWWRNAATGEVVATPDPSYRPLDADAWMELGPDWAGEGKEEPPVDVDPPIDGRKPIEGGEAWGDDGATDAPPARDDGLPPEGILPDYLRLGFKSAGLEGEMAARAITWWKNAVTGELVWTPDPSFQPPEPADWLDLGSDWPWQETDASAGDDAALGKDPAQRDATAPDSEAAAKDGTGTDTDPAAVDGQTGADEPAAGGDSPDDGTSPQADLAARYLKLGFSSELADGEMVAQVVNWWRNAATGEVVATPDPSYRPLDADAWMELGPDWTGGGKEEPPVDVDPPVDTDPPIRIDPPVDIDPPVRDPADMLDGGEQAGLPPRKDPTPGDDAATDIPKPLPQQVTDVELVAYHWKSRAVLEKTVWRMGEQVESLVGESMPRLFQPVLEGGDAGGQRLALRMSAGREGAPAPVAVEAGTGSVQDAAPTTAPDAAAVNLRDAVAILKMIAGLTSGGSPSPFQSIAADFDGSGTVGIGDALGVLRHAVGATSAKPDWVFVDETDPGLPGRAGMNPGLLPQEPAAPHAVSGKLGLVGVLRGDVDGSWAPPASAEHLDDAWFADLASRAGARNPDVSFDPSMWGVYPG